MSDHANDLAGGQHASARGIYLFEGMRLLHRFSSFFETWRPASRYNIRVVARMAAGGSCTGPATAEMDQGILDEKAHSPTLLLSVRSQVLNVGICVREYLAA